MSGASDFRNFREAVDHILSMRDRTLIKLLYLTAARPSEVCTKTTPSELRSRATKPYGISMNWQLDKFKKEKDVLLIKVALAQRRQSLPSHKIIALPIHPDFEPWTLDLLKRIGRNKKLEFDLTRVTVNKIVRERLSPLLGREIRAKDLREFRLEHLANLYDFDPYDLAAIAGLNLKKNLILIDKAAKKTETLTRLALDRYLPKLFRPLAELRP
jgi:integrase